MAEQKMDSVMKVVGIVAVVATIGYTIYLKNQPKMGHIPKKDGDLIKQQALRLGVYLGFALASANYFISKKIFL